MAYNNLRFILVQINMPYVQSGIGRMYCLSPCARENWGVKSFRVEDESLRFRFGSFS
jgi:hypothetical protein